MIDTRAKLAASLNVSVPFSILPDPTLSIGDDERQHMCYCYLISALALGVIDAVEFAFQCHELQLSASEFHELTLTTRRHELQLTVG